MDERLENLFAALDVKPVDVSFSRKENKLTALLLSKRPLAGAEENELRATLGAMIPGCDVALEVRAQAQDFDAAAAALAKAWEEDAPLLRPYIREAAWSCADGVVTARVPEAMLGLPNVARDCALYEARAAEVLGAPVRLRLEADATLVPHAEEMPPEEPTIVKKSAKAAKKPDVRLLYGRMPSLDKAMRMGDVQENAGNITICGTILSLEKRERKDKGLIVQAVLSDRSGAICTKVFLDPNEKAVADKMEACKADGERLLVRGGYTMDTWLKRMCVSVRDMAVTPDVRREDTAAEKRVELHLHTKMSSMDALVDPDVAVKTAARWGHRAVAITDHGVVQAFPAAVNAANKLKKAGKDIKVVLGVEGYLLPDCTLIPWAGQEFASFALRTAKGLDMPVIFEIAAVRFDAVGAEETLALRVDPGVPITAEMRRAGYTEEYLESACVLYDALRQIGAFIGERTVVSDRETAHICNAYCERLELKADSRFVDAAALCGNLKLELPQTAKDAAAQAVSYARGLQSALAVLRDRQIDTLPLSDSRTPEKVKGRRSNYHIILLAKNHTGLVNLYRLVSLAHLEHLKKVPQIPRSVLSLYREGLIVGSACEAGEMFHAVLDDKSPAELAAIASFYDYLEIQPVQNNAFLVREGRVKDEEGLRALNTRIADLADSLGKMTVATGDVHFLDPEDAIFRTILMSARDFKDAEQQAPLYFKTTAEMLEEFAYLGPERCYAAVVKNPNAIADMCEAMPPFLSEKGTYAPVFPGAEAELRGMAEKRAHEIYGEPLPEVVQKRLDKELNSIIGNGYASLYLMAQRLVHKSNEDGYLVGSRGSVGSSLVATMAGITEVNPLQPHYVCPKCRHSDFDVDRSVYACGIDLPDKNCPACGTPYQKLGYEIPFETFLGFKGDKTPDIDLNFSSEYQPRAHAYTEVMFGKGHAFRAGTISGLQEKTVYGYVMKYCEQTGTSLSKDEVDRLVAGCSGVKRTTGQHPGGIVIVPEENDILEFTPVQYPADKASAGTVTTHFDFHAMDDRLVKLDILGHVDPTALRMLQDMTGLDPRAIPLDDPDTMALFSTQAPLGIDLKELGCDVGSLGIPEFGTGFVRQMLMDTRPTTMEELVRIAGLSHGTNVWLGNAQDLVRAGTATLRDVICTRDDIMNFLILQGGDPSMSFKTMESVRKGRGLTPDMEAHMQKLPIPDWFPDSCKKIGYMFPRAHAAAYVMMAFRVAYYKVHYPAAFYAVYFQCRAGDDFDIAFARGGDAAVLKNIKALKKKSDPDPKDDGILTALEVVYEMNLRGIDLMDVDIYRSDARRFLIEGERLLPPLCSVAGVGENAAEGIAAAGKAGRYISLEDFQKRSKANSGVVSALKAAGCLDGLPETNQMRLF